MTTVYLVSSGSYSDYGVIGIYSTRENAERRALMVRDANEIAEYELDEGISILASGKRPWEVLFYPGGRVRVSMTADFKDASDGRILDWREQAKQRANSDWAEFLFDVLATDEAHALKIAQDKRAEYLAKETGV